MRYIMMAAAIVASTAVPALAQSFTPPNSDIRALEPPVDYRAHQFRNQSFQNDVPYQGRSAYVPGANNTNETTNR